jgi:predicted amidohydrolase YtcJ
MNRAQPEAQAMAIHGNRIVAVGTNDEVLDLAGASTRVIDAKGRLILPGFNDAHVHFLSGGFSLSSVNLRSAHSPAEMVQVLAAHASNLPKGTWITGGEWDHENWPGAPLPTRQMIDAAVPDHPVLVSRLDGHMSVANSLALRLAAITRATIDPPGGYIVRDSQSGEPQGVLKDSAVDLVTKVIPPPSLAEKRQAALAATNHAAQLGVTSVTDVSGDDNVGLYQELCEQGLMKTRIYAARPIVSWEVLGKTGLRAPFGNDLLRVGGIKGFSDGSLGSTTAFFFEPYADEPQTRGLLFDQMFPEGIMLERVTGADAAGLQVMIHAIGDEANYQILEIFRQVAERNGPRDRRFRIEHAQHLRLGDISRFAQQKVIASMQPYHAADDGRWCDKRLGPDRARSAYPFRSLLDTGAVLAFGSDWTVAPLNPILGIKAAVTRQTLDGRHPDGWIPEQKMSVDEAVHAFTVGSAYAEFAEKEKGCLAPGMLADMVMLDRDIFRIDPGEIDTAKAVLTVMNGNVVFEVK